VANKALIIDNPDMTLDQKVVALLSCIAQEKKSDIDRSLAECNLSYLQLNLLHTLSKSESGTLTVNQLKAAMIEDNPNVSRTLNKMVDMGLITKTRSDEDQRTVYVKITSKGEEMHELGDDCLGHLTSGLSPKDQKNLFALLQKL